VDNLSPVPAKYDDKGSIAVVFLGRFALLKKLFTENHAKKGFTLAI